VTTFAEIVAAARAITGWTDAEFDYSLSLDPDDRGFNAVGAITSAAHQLANAHLPEELDFLEANEDSRQREANAQALMDHVRPELDAMIAAAKAKSYTGGQGQRIEYAR
jgi:hypothetical protein